MKGVLSIFLSVAIGLTLTMPLVAQPDPDTPDDPAAHALYDKMISALREAKTLSFQSEYRWESKGRKLGHCIYTAHLMKPNFFRIETLDLRRDKPAGTIVGDGDDMWIYWPGERPRFSSEDHEAYATTSRNVYMHERTPVGRHSIGHKTGLLGAGMSMPVLDPSTFHGYTDSLQRYLTAVRSLGVETVDGEECDVIEVNLMKGQRLWTLWISKRDRIPRKLRQVVRVSYDIITEERWTHVMVDAAVPPRAELFAWSPPKGWKEWRLPAPASRLLKPGQLAPDFTLDTSANKKVSLSSYRGKVVWLVFWRVG